MKATVCELRDGESDFSNDWERLISHVAEEHSQLVVLPEMPFAPWLPKSPGFDAEAWNAAVDAHDRWELRLPELAPAIVAGTRPVDFGNERYNEGFVWSSADAFRSAHAKSCVRSEKGCWEAGWYMAAPAPDFEPIQLGDLTLGFLIGAELSATEEAERYGRESVKVLVSPRSTPVADIEQWLAAIRNAAQCAGAFVLCSSRAGQGPGWIVDPAGDLVASTSSTHPFVTAAIAHL